MSFFHHLTIGHFDPDLVYPWRRVVVHRELTSNEIEAIAHAAAEALGHPVDLEACRQPNGVLRILWHGDLRQKRIAEAVADAAHRLFGAVAADREHGRVIVPPPAPPPWPRLLVQLFEYDRERAREVVVDRAVDAEDVEILARVASEDLAEPVRLHPCPKSDGVYVILNPRAPTEADAVFAATTRLFGVTVSDIPRERARPWE